jgi:hypothetical protein
MLMQVGSLEESMRSQATEKSSAGFRLMLAKLVVKLEDALPVPDEVHGRMLAIVEVADLPHCC